MNIVIVIINIFVLAAQPPSSLAHNHTTNVSVHQEIAGLRSDVHKLKVEKDQEITKLRTANGLLREEMSRQRILIDTMKGAKATTVDRTVEQRLALLQSTLSKVRREEHCRLIDGGDCGPCICRDDFRLSAKHYCDCQHVAARRDCLDHYRHGMRINGIYQIHQFWVKSIRIFCDMTTDGGGWSVFQRRLDGSVEFYRGWDDYKDGFGALQHEFWLGNEAIYTLTLQGRPLRGNQLRVEMEDWDRQRRFAKYGHFEIGNETAEYRLHVSGYTGTAGDAMWVHNGEVFKTFDSKDNNCSIRDHGGWWYYSCSLANLNGRYYIHNEGGEGRFDQMSWDPIHQDHSLKMVEMKIRRIE